MPLDPAQILKYAVYLVLFIMPVMDIVRVARQKAAETRGPVRLTVREIFSAVCTSLGICCGVVFGSYISGKPDLGTIALAVAGAFLLGTGAGYLASLRIKPRRKPSDEK